MTCIACYNNCGVDNGSDDGNDGDDNADDDGDDVMMIVMAMMMMMMVMMIQVMVMMMVVTSDGGSGDGRVVLTMVVICFTEKFLNALSYSILFYFILFILFYLLQN